MASICEICGKGKLAGNNVSHSNRHTKRAWNPNIQQVRAVVEGSVKRLNVCTVACVPVKLTAQSNPFGFKKKPNTNRYLVSFFVLILLCNRTRGRI